MFCVRVLEERAMSEKLFFVDKIFWHSVWDTSNLHNSPECYGNIASLPDDHQLFVTSLTTAVILAATHLGTGGKKADCVNVSRVSCHVSRLKRSFVAGPRRKRSWTAWWARQCTTPGYGRRESTEQVSSVRQTARSRLQPSQTFNKIWDIWAGADRRVISCQVLYEFQLLKALTSAL